MSYCRITFSHCSISKSNFHYAQCLLWADLWFLTIDCRWKHFLPPPASWLLNSAVYILHHEVKTPSFKICVFIIALSAIFLRLLIGQLICSIFYFQHDLYYFYSYWTSRIGEENWELPMRMRRTLSAGLLLALN